MEKLSVAIITKNEEHNIERCLKAIQWADEVLVVDSGSTDKTLEICRQHQCRIIETEWMGFGRTKQFSVEHASHDWILVVDADEEVTEALAHRINEILSAPDEHRVYACLRISYYLGKRIKFCWGTDYVKRLFNRKKAHFDSKNVHESLVTDAKVEKIKEPMLHYTYPTIASHIRKINLYSSLGAEISHEKGKRPSLLRSIFRGIHAFIEMYFFNLGFLDGKKGLILSIISGHASTIKYFKIWEIQHNKQHSTIE